MTHRLSLRTRLTFVYATLLAVALLVYAGCVSAFFLHSLREQLDMSLDRDVEAVEGALSIGAGEQIELGSEEGEVRENGSQQGFLLEVWSPAGKLLYRSESLDGKPLGPAPNAASKLQQESPKSFRLSSGLRVRALSRVHHLAQGRPVLVITGIKRSSTMEDQIMIRKCTIDAIMLGVVMSASVVSSIAQKPLQQVADIPMPGPAVRFDYQNLDVEHNRLYIAHMNADQLVVFDMKKRRVVANLDGFKRVHGVIAVPDISRVYASVTGEHQVAAVDMNTLKTVATTGPVTYPDGLAYSPATRRVFVSDERGDADAVVDSASGKLLTNIPLGGGAGNTVYDSGSGHILVAVHSLNELVEIDPAPMKIIGRYSLPGIKNPHGIALDVVNRLAFVAGEENHSLGVFDLKSKKVLSIHEVGEDPDVLAFDPGLKRLYVSAESGKVTVLEENERGVKTIGQLYMPHAHTVSVDPKTHLVYFPLENVGGHPLLRIMKPVSLH